MSWMHEEPLKQEIHERPVSESSLGNAQLPRDEVVDAPPGHNFESLLPFNRTVLKSQVPPMHHNKDHQQT